MELNFSKEELQELIKKYYLESEGRNIDVSFEVNLDDGNYFRDLACVTTIKISEEVLILGKSKVVTQLITKRDISDIIGNLLENEGYHLDRLDYLDGINREYRGYGMNEYQEKTPYFNGVKLTVSKVKTLERGRK